MLLKITALYYYSEHENERMYMLLSEEEAENTRLLQKIVQSKSAGLETFANDYTYWDEMVEFAQHPDTAWANDNITVSLPTYDVDFVWVYDTSFSRILFTHQEGFGPEDSSLVTPLLLNSVSSHKKLSHFFIKGSNGIYEISTATIHRTNDPERLSLPEGYFAACRLWKNERLEKIAELTGTTIVLVSLDARDSTFKEADPHNFVSNSFYMLQTWDKKPLAYIQSVKQTEMVKIMHEQFDKQFVLIVIFVTLLLILMSVSLYYIVNKPLSKLSKSLKDQDPSGIQNLLHKKSEYGEMANLVNEFFVQKEKLVKEIEVRIETEQKIRVSEEKLKNSLKEKDVLLKEVHHRVKNNLQIVMSLIRLQVNRMDDKCTIQHLQTSLNRIRSISLVHEMLYRSGDLGRIDFDNYIKKMTDSLSDMYVSGERDIRIKASAEEIYLGVDSAVPCAIIINELVTNSIKHAFNGSKNGKIDVTMKMSADKYLLTVKDNGIGIPSGLNINESKSLGMHLINTLSEQLDAELKFDNSTGTSCTLLFSSN